VVDCFLLCFALSTFGGCSPPNWQPPKASRTKAKKKAVKSLADRSRHDLYARCFSRADCYIGRLPLAKRNGLLLRPSLMVVHVGARCQRAQDRIQIYQTAQSALDEGAPKGRRPMLADEKKRLKQKAHSFHLKCEPRHSTEKSDVANKFLTSN